MKITLKYGLIAAAVFLSFVVLLASFTTVDSSQAVRIQNSLTKKCVL